MSRYQETTSLDVKRLYAGEMAIPRHLRPADELLVPVVQKSIEEMDLTEADKAASGLAILYAEAIDQAEPEDRSKVLIEVGPKLLTVLESLGGSPRARAAIKKGVTSAKDGSRLQTLRAARNA